MKKSVIFALSMVLGLMGILALPGASWPEHYESYFLYLGDHPADKSPGWHEDVQGVTHDDNYWFITQSDADGDLVERALWKIPVGHDLAAEMQPGVDRRLLDNTPLGPLGYNHFGDLTYYYNEKYDKKGYLVIPVEAQHEAGWGTPVIAVFTSDDLEYIGHDEVEWEDGTRNLGWCAIDPKGYLYTSSAIVSSCYKYKLSWDLLPNEVKLELVGEVPFLDENGNSITLTHMQGGVFSESGDLLYVVSGMYDQHYDNDGITVFDTKTWRRVAHSTGDMPFLYGWHPGDAVNEEPEGLTIWDLDDGRAPGIRGQLHVLVLDNDSPDDDDVYFDHFTGTIYVDGDYTGDEAGRPWDPFNTVSEANDFYPAWDGARISIKAGTYPESLTFSKQIQLLAREGTANIGLEGRISLTPPGTVNIYKGGGLKIH